MGSAPFKSDNVQQTQRRFGQFWTTIEDDVRDHDWLSLREAANIIGFRSFPVGWTWAEFALRKNAKAASYEAEGQAIFRMGVSRSSTPDQEGQNAANNALRFRSKSARSLLYRLTSQKRVPLRLSDADAYGRIASERELLDETLLFSITESTISVHGYKERAAVGGGQLIKALNSKTPIWKTKSPKHDWLLAERLTRDEFETVGCKPSDLTVIKQCRERYTQLRPNSPDLTQSTFAKLVADLRREFTSDE
jgi:hypothetical protein